MSAALSRRRLLLAASAALPAALLGGTAAAAAPEAPAGWPDRAVRVVIPVAPGGSLDILGRVLARQLTPALGQPVVAENHPGAGSNLAFELVARARPDGLTLLVGSDPLTINPSLYRRIGFDPVRDFAPIVEAVRAPQVLVVRNSLPATDVETFLRLSREAEGQMTMASQGNGSIGHLTAQMLAGRTGLAWTHVPYRGGGPAVLDVVAGHIDALLVTLPAAIEHIRGGRIRALAVSSAARSPALPDVPALAERGLPGFDVVTWQGLLAPAGTHPGIIARVNAAVREALKRPEVASQLAAQGFTVTGSTPEDFSELVREEAERWPPIVRASGAQLD
jgi:tripartite-type tricarboxylate transporter receptor subunit TctC